MLHPRMDPWGTPQWTVTFWKCIEMNQWKAFWQIWSELISAAFGTDCHNVLLGRMFLPFRSKRATTDRRPASDAIPRLLLTVCYAASELRGSSSGVTETPRIAQPNTLHLFMHRSSQQLSPALSSVRAMEVYGAANVWLSSGQGGQTNVC